MQRNGIVAAGDAATAIAGRDILKQGGNAVDAAVAASFAACVAEPMLTSLASGGYMLIHKDDRNVLIDGMCVMPKITLEQPEKIVVDFGDAQQPFFIGRGSVAPPGQLAALIYAQRTYGSLPWNKVLRPAIRLAREGVNLSPFQAYVLELLRDVVRFTPEARKIYAPDGEPLKTGTLFRNETFADFLEELVQNPSAEILRAPYEKAGIPFELLEAREREPLKITFREYDVLTNPLPSPGGVLIAYTLKALERHWPFDPFDSAQGRPERNRTGDSAQDKPESMEGRITALVTAFRNADWVRKEKVDGHWSDTTLVQRILGNTTHISVIDKDGNAVSATSSNGQGAGMMLEDTGIMPNNLLGEPDLNPAGFFTHPAGTVLPSMMSPTFLLRDGKIAAALGSAGSERIRSAIVQVTLNLLDGLTPQDAVSAPRIHWDGSTVQVEPLDSARGKPTDQSLIKALKKATSLPVNLWKEQNLYFGGVQLVTPEGGGADPRRGGAVA